jgi:hydrogenase maturation protein HypF
MTTYRIHIKGQVQGVGFRPIIYRRAVESGLKGWISNGVDGVHLEVQGDEYSCREFYESVLHNPPGHARITDHVVEIVRRFPYDSFRIVPSDPKGTPDLLLTPDLAPCKECKDDILSQENRRYNYAFTTCTQCGPRYSIMRALPYDRHTTSMHSFKCCNVCQHEYATVLDRRYYSQTNSCPNCGVTISLTDANGIPISSDINEVLAFSSRACQSGKILAVKGIGGYLLICNASKAEYVMRLRNRKRRPAKPFALLYPSVERITVDAFVSDTEAAALESAQAPIVVLNRREKNTLAAEQIAPGLDTLGVMLPSSALLFRLMLSIKNPVIATSGNVSGSPIFYLDDEALTQLGSVADYFITHNLPLAVPQDDSVIRFTRSGERIILRRSRGMGPTFLPNPLKNKASSILAMGGDLKSVFAIQHLGNVHISQFLGELSHYETQKNYRRVLDHLQHLTGAVPEQILVDKHPHYFSAHLGRTLIDDQVVLTSVQHHEAHAHAVLAENDLTDTAEPVLCVVWDGTGWGNDDNVWGGEFFVYQHDELERMEHIPYFAHIANDKFSREPRIAALSLFSRTPGADQLLRKKFSREEWDLYRTLLSNKKTLMTSSMGRVFDAVASIMDVCDISTYEGQAAMYLERLAAAAAPDSDEGWFQHNPFSIAELLKHVVEAIANGQEKESIAYNFHVSLVDWISQVAEAYQLKYIAFSGGVFQNALLVGLIQERMARRFSLLWHKQLSPNDECLAFGQLAFAQQSRKTSSAVTDAEATTCVPSVV